MDDWDWISDAWFWLTAPIILIVLVIVLELCGVDTGLFS